jgi:hypothetical protein
MTAFKNFYLQLLKKWLKRIIKFPFIFQQVMHVNDRAKNWDNVKIIYCVKTPHLCSHLEITIKFIIEY